MALHFGAPEVDSEDGQGSHGWSQRGISLDFVEG